MKQLIRKSKLSNMKCQISKPDLLYSDTSSDVHRTEGFIEIIRFILVSSVGQLFNMQQQQLYLTLISRRFELFLNVKFALESFQPLELWSWPLLNPLSPKHTI